jgi:hypothetical protein
MPKPPVFESIWTNKPPDPAFQERWDAMLDSRRPKSPEDIEAAQAYAIEFSLFKGYIARTMRANVSSRTYQFKKAKVVVSKVIEGWWKAEFYRFKTPSERLRLSAIFEPFAFSLPDAPTERTPEELQQLLDELAAI